MRELPGTTALGSAIPPIGALASRIHNKAPFCDIVVRVAAVICDLLAIENPGLLASAAGSGAATAATTAATKVRGAGGGNERGDGNNDGPHDFLTNYVIHSARRCANGGVNIFRL